MNNNPINKVMPEIMPEIMEKNIMPEIMQETISGTVKNINNEKEILKINKLENIQKWIVALTYGTISIFTCCMCCGCCGKLRGPNAILDINDTIYNNLSKDEQQIINITNWCGLAAIAYKCGLPTCGCCCGCFGRISPKDAITILKNTEKK